VPAERLRPYGSCPIEVKIDGEWRAGTLIECRRLFTPHLATVCASLTLSTSGVPLTGDIVPLSVGGPRGRRAAVS
jgi:hypothetical protein